MKQNLHMWFIALLVVSIEAFRLIPKISLNPAKQMQHIGDFWGENLYNKIPAESKVPASPPTVTNDPQDKIHGFNDIIGGAPQDIIELVDQFKNPEKYRKAGIVLPKNIILVGPPGTGKTSLARAMWQEMGSKDFTFISKTGSDFVDVYVGMGARKVRNLFDQARRSAPSIIFIDEIDAVGKRDEGHSEQQQTINALLKELDGIETNDNVIVIAATNFIKNVDPALLRSGRFKVIEILMPDEHKRELILKHYCKNIKLASDVDLKKIAEHTNNFTPADLEQLVNQASTYAMREKYADITMDLLVRALKEMWIERQNKGERNVRRHIDALNIAFDKDKTESENLGFRALAGDIDPEILDIVHYLQHPNDYKHFGVHIPRGVLMVGPPGTGKTSLARALAHEAHCEFMSVKASEFVEIYVGTGAKRIRELFEKARSMARGNEKKMTIVFIDEIDAIGSRDVRSNNQEASQTIAELLGQMDGFDADDSILVIAATNCPQALDSALLRPGRFDVIVKVPLPDESKRLAILTFYCKNRPIDSLVSLEDLSVSTEGCSPADLKNLVNEAAKIAMREKQGKIITKEHFETALTKAGERRLIGTHGNYMMFS